MRAPRFTPQQAADALATPTAINFPLALKPTYCVRAHLGTYTQPQTACAQVHPTASRRLFCRPNRNTFSPVSHSKVPGPARFGTTCSALCTTTRFTPQRQVATAARFTPTASRRLRRRPQCNRISPPLRRNHTRHPRTHAPIPIAEPPRDPILPRSSCQPSLPGYPAKFRPAQPSLQPVGSPPASELKRCPPPSTKFHPLTPHFDFAQN